MRLLNCHTKALEWFMGQAPLYAILSHTWEDEEVVFGDLNDVSINHTTMKGWYKIERSCDQAIKDGLDYIWADTLCIDKSSSTELSEAINSMYSWYRDSAICYAYLVDLPASKLEDSRWFTRGWTLQELIAPKNIKFYDKNWDFQGAKADLLLQLQNITNVDAGVLQGGSLHLIQAAKKLSWAAKRKTTRSEDMAYSLLGILGISMPMLYGEGPRAFIRLQEELVRQYDDETIFAWRDDAATGYTGLFAPSPAAFAHSADIFPCQSRLSVDSQVEPITVGSRGLRIAARLQPHKAGDLSSPTFLMRLNCKKVHFDMRARDRIGIVVTRRFGVGDIYSRIMSDQLFTFNPNARHESKTIFALKESSVGELDLMENCGFWLRTMPSWPTGQFYRLAAAHPSEHWDTRNNMFRRGWQNADKRPFIVVFQKVGSDGEAVNSFFVVFLGIEEVAQPDVSWMRQQMWCKVRFQETIDLTPEGLDREVGTLDWDLILSRVGSTPGEARDRSSHADGGDMVFKCYTQLEVVDGQHLFCADLHVKTLDVTTST